MYAVIETGGKQYRVQQGDIIDVERLADAGEPGSDIEFDRVLMVGGEDDAVQLGMPVIDGAKVSAKLVDEVRGTKVIVFKKKRRKQYRRRNGHRQALSRVRIENIQA